MYLKKRSKTIRSKRIQTENVSAAGAVVFQIENKTIKVLLLRQSTTYQEEGAGEGKLDIGPRGHVKRGESTISAAYREAVEELGFSLHLDSGFKETEEYTFSSIGPKHKKIQVKKKAVFFLAPMYKRDRRQISLSKEHTNYYLLPIDEAIEKVKFANEKKILEKAREYVISNYLT